MPGEPRKNTVAKLISIVIAAAAASQSAEEKTAWPEEDERLHRLADTRARV
jgi:hypothetical protein